MMRAPAVVRQLLDSAGFAPGRRGPAPALGRVRRRGRPASSMVCVVSTGRGRSWPPVVCIRVATAAAGGPGLLLARAEVRSLQERLLGQVLRVVGDPHAVVGTSSTSLRCVPCSASERSASSWPCRVVVAIRRRTLHHAGRLGDRSGSWRAAHAVPVHRARRAYSRRWPSTAPAPSGALAGARPPRPSRPLAARPAGLRHQYDDVELFGASSPTAGGVLRSVRPPRHERRRVRRRVREHRPRAADPGRSAPARSRAWSSTSRPGPEPPRWRACIRPPTSCGESGAPAARSRRRRGATCCSGRCWASSSGGSTRRTPTLADRPRGGRVERARVGRARGVAELAAPRAPRGRRPPRRGDPPRARRFGIARRRHEPPHVHHRASGFAGATCVAAAGRRDVCVAAPSSSAADLRDPAVVRALIADARPDVVSPPRRPRARRSSPGRTRSARSPTTSR